MVPALGESWAHAATNRCGNGIYYDVYPFVDYARAAAPNGAVTPDGNFSSRGYNIVLPPPVLLCRGAFLGQFASLLER